MLSVQKAILHTAMFTLFYSFSSKTHGRISFKAPFTGKKYQAGVQQHVAIEAPHRALLRKAESGQIEFAITPGHIERGTPSGSIQLLTFHRRPYTAIINDELWPTSIISLFLMPF